MIQTRALVKTFDGFRALDGLDLHVPHGAIYGLVGPNGSGKSTVIRHLTGIYRQDSGEVRVDGKPVFENPEVKARIAYIPDELFYFPQAGIRDMKEFYQGIYPRFSEERFRKLRGAFSLDERAPIRRMSKGMQKQAAFWLAMCQCPDILILDEPVDGLDPVMRRQVWSIIMQDVAEKGTTVLVSSHNLRELEDVCDHVGILKNGKILLEHSLSDLQENLVKVQMVLPDGAAVPPGLQILHQGGVGRLKTLILRGRSESVVAQLSAVQPIFMDVLPLSLEEVFIYELGGEQYAVKDIVL